MEVLSVHHKFKKVLAFRSIKQAVNNAVGENKLNIVVVEILEVVIMCVGRELAFGCLSANIH